MNQQNSATLFPDTIVFPDVDPDTLAREESGYRTARAMLTERAAWPDDLRKVLPPGSRVGEQRTS